MKYIIFNPEYTLKPDDGRALIMASIPGRDMLKDINDSFTNVIHPIYAMILTFVNGRSYEVCINNAAITLGVSEELIKNFIDSLTDNPNRVFFKCKDGVSAFPPNTILSRKEECLSERYIPSLFEYNRLDIHVKRHKTPSNITLMFNNICVTNCIYCYQDKSRRVHCTIPLQRVIELIHEAHSLHVNTFDVIGGEFFLYEHWKEVLTELREFGYNPYLSTKMPLDEDCVKYLAELNIFDIQISLDTLIEEHLIPSLKVKKGYAQKMIKCLELLDKYNIPILIHSVLTQYNDSIKDMQSVFEVLKNLKNLKAWLIVKGDETLYPRTKYKNIEISSESLSSISKYLNQLANNTNMIIRAPQSEISESSAAINTELNNNEQNKFFDRAFCSGLFSSLYILPDGKVTMCEQLYWKERFIVGNVMENSISEIWNSEKAKSIFYIKQSDIPEDSLCHSCSQFKKCRGLKQVCYREIIKKYGDDKWYYPDVNCPFTKNDYNGN